MSLNQRRFAGALLLVPLCVSGIVFSLFRQIPAASGLALAQAGGVTSLRVEVELVTVEVIVLDKKGTPVRSLKKEDFQLFEDGKPQEISTFDEITDDARLPSSLPDDNDPARIHGKVVLILFDDSRIASENLKLTRDSAEKYVREHMKPQDLFAIATYGTTGLKLLQNYTHDGDRVLAAIRQPAVSSARATTAGESSQEIPRTAGMRPGTGPQTTPDLSPSLGREDKYRSLAMLRGLKTLISSLEAIKGRKSILLYSEEFAITADLAIELGGTVSSARKANVAFYTIDAGGLKSGRPAGSSLKQVSPDAGTSREAALRGSSGTNTVSGRLGLLAGILNAGARETSRSLMFQQTGSTQGGGQTSGGGSSGRGSGSSSSQASTQSMDQPDVHPALTQSRSLTNTLRSLANETGGLAIFNTSDFNTQLDKMEQELSNYYVLGFVTNNPKRDGRFRKLEVRTQLKGVTVKYRSGYSDKRPLDTLASSKEEKTLTAVLASASPAAQVPVIFRAIYFYDSPRLSRIPVLAKIRTDSLVPRKKKGALAADLNIIGAAYAEDGSVAARFSETLSVPLDKSTQENLRRPDFSYRNYFKLRPGKYRLKLGVLDDRGKAGSAEQFLEIPSCPENGIAGSSLVIIDQASRLPELIQNLETRLLEENDPLTVGGLVISPSVENQVTDNKSVLVFYKLFSIGFDPAQANFVARVQLVDEKGTQVRALAPMPLKQNMMAVGKSETAVAIKPSFEDVGVGKYKLVVETVEANSNRSVTLATDLEFR